MQKDNIDKQSREIKTIKVFAVEGRDEYNIYISNEAGIVLVRHCNHPTDTMFQVLGHFYKILDGDDMPSDYHEREEYLPGYRPVFCLCQRPLDNDKIHTYYYNDDRGIIIVDATKTLFDEINPDAAV